MYFDANGQLEDMHALDEMEIAENGPEFVHADKIIKQSMDSYWRNNGSCDGSWHFCQKNEDIRTFTKQSKVVEKHIKVKPKFLFMSS